MRRYVIGVVITMLLFALVALVVFYWRLIEKSVMG